MRLAIEQESNSRRFGNMFAQDFTTIKLYTFEIKSIWSMVLNYEGSTRALSRIVISCLHILCLAAVGKQSPSLITLDEVGCVT